MQTININSPEHSISCKEKIFGFAEWISENGWQYHKHHELWDNQLKIGVKNTIELYQMYLKWLEEHGK